MKKNGLYRWCLWLSRAIYLQLILTTLALPLVVAAGIPFSLLAIVGNLLFVPFLLCFIVLSLCIFTGEIMQIPNDPLIQGLDHLYDAWIRITSLASPSVVIEFARFPGFITLVLILGAFAVLHYRTMRPLFGSFFLLMLLLVVSGITSYTHTRYTWLKSAVPMFPFIEWVRLGSQIICIDRGTATRATDAVLARRLQSTLRTVRKELGGSAPHMLIFLKPTRASLHLAKQLLNGSHKGILLFPTCSAYTPQALAKALQACQQWAIEQGHTVLWLNKKFVCAENSDGSLYVNCSGIIHRSKRFSHPRLVVEGTGSCKDISIGPVRARREQVLHQPLPEPEAGT